jgi:hypothetical protein
VPEVFEACTGLGEKYPIEYPAESILILTMVIGELLVG